MARRVRGNGAEIERRWGRRGAEIKGVALEERGGNGSQLAEWVDREVAESEHKRVEKAHQLDHRLCKGKP